MRCRAKHWVSFNNHVPIAKALANDARSLPKMRPIRARVHYPSDSYGGMRIRLLRARDRRVLVWTGLFCDGDRHGPGSGTAVTVTYLVGEGIGGGS